MVGLHKFGGPEPFNVCLSFRMDIITSASGKSRRSGRSLEVRRVRLGRNNNYAASQLIASGPDLSGKWATVTQCGQTIDLANIKYRPLTANSNSVIATCLAAAGLPQVVVDEEFGLWTPGEHDLRQYYDLSGVYGASELEYSGVLSYYEGLFGRGIGSASYNMIDILSISGRWVESTGSYKAGSPVWIGEDEKIKFKPIVLDLDGDGVELTAAVQSPGFDFFGTGRVNATGWFSGGDALLVYDGNANGVVDDVSELSFLHNSPESVTDLQALAAFDSNNNNYLDAGDGAFGLFKLWRDHNFNGISEPGELVTLFEGDVSSLSLLGQGGPFTVSGNDVYASTTFFRLSGGSGVAFDVGFEAHSRGSRHILDYGQWSVLELDNSEVVAVAKSWSGPISIGDVGGVDIAGYFPTGFQLGAGDDSVSSGSGSYGKGFYVDGGDGNDIIDLSGATVGSVIRGGGGDDVLTGTLADDYYYPGGYGQLGGDCVLDYGGDDTYVAGAGVQLWIDDNGGEDTLFLSGVSFSEIRITQNFWGDGIILGSSSRDVFVNISNMLYSSQYGIDYLVLDDRTLTRDDIINYAIANGLGY